MLWTRQRRHIYYFWLDPMICRAIETIENSPVFLALRMLTMALFIGGMLLLVAMTVVVDVAWTGILGAVEALRRGWCRVKVRWLVEE